MTAAIHSERNSGSRSGSHAGTLGARFTGALTLAPGVAESRSEAGVLRWTLLSGGRGAAGPPSGPLGWSVGDVPIMFGRTLNRPPKPAFVTRNGYTAAASLASAAPNGQSCCRHDRTRNTAIPTTMSTTA